QAPGQPGELARVAERFQIQQDDVGRWIVLPVLQQVVAGDIGTVAGGDERGQAESPVPGSVQQCHAERAGLAEEPDPAARGQLGGEGGVEAYGGIGVGDPQAVGADQAYSGGPDGG